MKKESYSDITILVDVDDVLVDLLGAWCNYLNNKHNLSVKPEDITEWDMSKFYPTLTKKELYYPLRMEDFWRTIKPKKDAVKYLKLLIKDGFKVYLCTATDYRNIKAKHKFVINKYFPFINWNNVIVAYDKTMIKADFLVDDGIHNLEGGSYIKLLMSAPHNRNYNAPANKMIRLENWESIYKEIKKLSDCIIFIDSKEGI